MPKILIVDDEPNIIELARLYLERDGYQYRRRLLPQFYHCVNFL